MIFSSSCYLRENVVFKLHPFVRFSLFLSLFCLLNLNFSQPYRSLYNMACIASLQNEFQEALSHLKDLQITNALPPLSFLLQDRDLENVRKCPEFHLLFRE